MEYKRLVENWKRFVKEEEEKSYDKEQGTKLRDLLASDYESFVTKLADEIEDPKFQDFLEIWSKYDN